MTTSTSHASHSVAEFPDTCARCTQEWYGVEDLTFVDVTVDKNGSYRVLKLTDIREARAKSEEER